jgi:hypothetical protein
MGTTWSVVMLSNPDGTDANNLKQLLQKRLDQINSLLSTYDPASEISRFNNQPSPDWFAISEETAKRSNNRVHPRRIGTFLHVHTPCEDLCLGNLGPLAVTKRTYIFTYIFTGTAKRSLFKTQRACNTTHAISI